MADHVPLHGERVVLLGDVHQHPVRDQRDVSPHHVQGQVVGHPDGVAPGLAANVLGPYWSIRRRISRRPSL